MGAKARQVDELSDSIRGTKDALVLDSQDPFARLAARRLRRDRLLSAQAKGKPWRSYTVQYHFGHFVKTGATHIHGLSRENQERLSSGDPLELCAVAKGLIRLRSQRPLAASDSAQLKKSLSLLAEEICVVLGGCPDQISRDLEQACLASLSTN